MAAIPSRKLSALIGGAVLMVLMGTTAMAQDEAALIAALSGKTRIVSVDEGLKTIEKMGTAISCRFEFGEDGKLQFSIFMTAGGRFSEVLVDPATGRIAKTTAITAGEDLATVKTQVAAFAKGNEILRAALARVIRKNRGGTAVSITPRLEAGRGVADITVLSKQTLKTISERLK